MRARCALLNHRGGRVLFGVEPDGRVAGQHFSDHTLEEVAHELREIEQPVVPAIERVSVGGGREVIVLSVGTGHSLRYTHRGQTYRCTGSPNQALSRGDYNRVLL